MSPLRRVGMICAAIAALVSLTGSAHMRAPVEAPFAEETHFAALERIPQAGDYLCWAASIQMAARAPGVGFAGEMLRQCEQAGIAVREKQRRRCCINSVDETPKSACDYPLIVGRFPEILRQLHIRHVIVYEGKPVPLVVFQGELSRDRAVPIVTSFNGGSQHAQVVWGIEPTAEGDTALLLLDPANAENRTIWYKNYVSAFKHEGAVRSMRYDPSYNTLVGKR